MRITAAAPDLKVPGDVTPPPPSLLHRLEGHCQISTGISRIGTIITTHTETKVRAITQAGELGILTIVNMVNFDVLTCTFYSKGIQSINFLHINPLQGCKKKYVLDFFFWPRSCILWNLMKYVWCVKIELLFICILCRVICLFNSYHAKMFTFYSF